MSFFNFIRGKKSFVYAIRGIKDVWREEQNFRFHIVTAFLIVILAILLKVKRGDFVILLILIGLVLILELVNTIFERLIDILKPRIHEYSKEIKNIASATVLLAALLSVLVGVFIFFPYFVEYFKK